MDKREIKNRDLIKNDEFKDILTNQQREYYAKKYCFRKQSYDAITKTLEQKFYDVERDELNKCWRIGERKEVESQRRDERKTVEWSIYSNGLFNNNIVKLDKNRHYTAKDLLVKCKIFLKTADYQSVIRKELSLMTSDFNTFKNKKRIRYDLDVIADDVNRYVNQQINQEVKRLIRDANASIVPVFYAVKNKEIKEVNELIYNEYSSNVNNIKKQYKKKDKEERVKVIHQFVNDTYNCDYMYRAYVIGDLSDIKRTECNEIDYAQKVGQLFTERLIKNARQRQDVIESYEELEEKICRLSNFDDDMKQLKSSMYNEQADFKAKRYREYADIYKIILKSISC